MSDRENTSIGAALDSKGKVLLYDGTTDCTKFFEDFDDYCELKGLGGVVSRQNFEKPRYPTQAFERQARGTPEERDYSNTSHYLSAMAKYVTKCQIVARLLKGALTDTLQMQLKTAFPAEFRTANRRNLEVLRGELIRRFAGWTDSKGEANFDAMKKIGNITSVESCDDCFYKLSILTQERASWNNPDQLYPDSFYRTWLLKRIADWKLLQGIWSGMKLDDDVSFAAGKDAVIKMQ